jgi:hypothetical protein
MGRPNLGEITALSQPWVHMQFSFKQILFSGKNEKRHPNLLLAIKQVLNYKANVKAGSKNHPVLLRRTSG